MAQFIGWMGELTQTNPMFNWRLYDSVLLLMSSTIRFVDAGWIALRRVTDAGMPSRESRRSPIFQQEARMPLDEKGNVAIFRNHTMKNEGKSKRKVAPIFDDLELCELRSPARRMCLCFRLRRCRTGSKTSYGDHAKLLMQSGFPGSISNSDRASSRPKPGRRSTICRS